MDAAKAFFRKAIKGQGSGPRTITLDGYAASHRAVREMKADGELATDTKLRSSKYLNNLVEQEPPGREVADRSDARVQAVRDRGDHDSRDRIAATDPQGAVPPRSATSSGSTCACRLGGRPRSPIRRQHRSLAATTFGSSGYLHQSPLMITANHLRRVGKGVPRSRHDTRRRLPPSSPRHHLRDERRKLSPQNRHPTTNRTRTPTHTRDNHRKRQFVAPRQSSRRNPLASVEQTRLTFQGRDHFLFLIVALQVLALRLFVQFTQPKILFY
ncbi:transposase [Acidiphilium sp. JA12-A1]|nr:transposase [Acidiphilium sp. JA12-A1]